MSDILLRGNSTTHILTVSRGERGDPGGGESIIELPFSYGDASPKLIGSAVKGLIVRASIAITEAFDTPSTLQLGTLQNPSLLINNQQNLAMAIGEYQQRPMITLSVFTQFVLSISLGAGNTKGKGFVFIDYTILGV